MWWPGRAEAAARKAGDVYVGGAGAALVIDEKTREQTTAAGDFDPARRLPTLRESLDAGANSSVLPILTVASLVGFGAVIAALPAFVVAMNVLAGLTDTASGGMAIALNALGNSFIRLAAEHGIDPALMHRLTAIRAGTLDALPHNDTVLRLLQISKLTHRESYFHVVMTVIVGVIISLVGVIALGSAFGSF
jgi:H+/gluconate symporter-like permease